MATGCCDRMRADFILVPTSNLSVLLVLVVVASGMLPSSLGAQSGKKINLLGPPLYDLIHQYYEARAESTAVEIEQQRKKSKKPHSPYWDKVASMNKYDRSAEKMMVWSDYSDWREYSKTLIDASRCVENGKFVDCILLGTREVRGSESSYSAKEKFRFSLRATRHGETYKLVAYKHSSLKGWCKLIAVTQSDCDG